MQHFLEYDGKKIEIDGNGYLLDYLDWDEELSTVIAQLEGIDLTPAHWEVVLFVRAFYEEYETSPAIRVLVKSLSNKFGPQIGNSRYVQRLFPKGPARQATKIAGLPKPAKCL
ncbi:TusE/DsrC/DsvC family sulfur relay protein [Brumicola pallidula]|uniref:Sulfurtransferase n=1 Tax=Brumicola pallidula DSM 14239 = ACAM 615 TaxID=1121922 RepID=K7A1F5_9ALTE|nr:TusE/DsrC/DsvC family sulfur relay protein [Glaciecola pallidula]GAC29320.1 sulfurtransferase tusE [Glaciecola pallidula DSM 14239 = ACAM 615]